VIPEALAGPLAVAFAWLTTYLLHSTVLIGGAWLVTLLVRLEPGTRDFLWRVALLGGLVTATGASLRASPAQEVTVVRRALEPTAGDGALRWQSHDGALMQVEARVADPSPACRALLRSGGLGDPGAVERIEELCADATPSWFEGLVLLWLLGAGAGGLVLVVDRRALALLGQSLRPAGRRARGLLAELGPGAEGVRLATSTEVAGPCALPARTIALPDRCEDELTDAELRAVLAHEVAHLSRRDPTWWALLRCAAALGWVQPLNRLALRRALEATEEACDDWALARTGERYGLASSISRVAGWVSAEPVRAAAVSMAGRGRGATSGRVRRILEGHGRAEPAWLRVGAALLIAAPLLLVPAVSVPAAFQASVIVEERGVLTAERRELVVPSEGEAVTRVFVARILRD
jgi:beta-lactamase regulating signal transducer with metallopeptidase domain